MSRARAVGVDIGTSGVRASALAGDGAVVGRASAAMATFGDPRAPEAWRSAFEAALGGLARACDVSSVVAVAVDGTSGTVLAVDADGTPIGPASMYDEPCPDAAIVAAVDAAAPPASAARGRTSGLARVLLMQGRPGVRQVLHQADWIAGLLSGRFGVSDANNALKTGYDPVAERWPDWIVRAGADCAKLPVVKRPGEPIGAVGPHGVALGLPPSAIVCAGTTDGCASFLATGAAETGDGVTALGSTLVVKLLCDHPISAPQYGIYSHRIGDRWLAGGASNAGGRVIAHLFPKERLDVLTAALKPDEPTGLDYYPLLAPGERFPIADPALPPRLGPRPADEARFFQAVLEGLAEVEALGYSRLAELGAPPLLSIRTVGGGASNAGWTRIRQRITGARMLPALSEDACDGVARLALKSLPGPSGRRN